MNGFEWVKACVTFTLAVNAVSLFMWGCEAASGREVSARNARNAAISGMIASVTAALLVGMP